MFGSISSKISNKILKIYQESSFEKIGLVATDSVTSFYMLKSCRDSLYRSIFLKVFCSGFPFFDIKKEQIHWEFLIQNKLWILFTFLFYISRCIFFVNEKASFSMICLFSILLTFESKKWLFYDMKKSLKTSLKKIFAFILYFCLIVICNLKNDKRVALFIFLLDLLTMCFFRKKKDKKLKNIVLYDQNQFEQLQDPLTSSIITIPLIKRNLDNTNEYIPNIDDHGSCTEEDKDILGQQSKDQLSDDLIDMDLTANVSIKNKYEEKRSLLYVSEQEALMSEEEFLKTLILDDETTVLFSEEMRNSMINGERSILSGIVNLDLDKSFEFAFLQMDFFEWTVNKLIDKANDSIKDVSSALKEMRSNLIKSLMNGDNINLASKVSEYESTISNYISETNSLLDSVKHQVSKSRNGIECIKKDAEDSKRYRYSMYKIIINLKIESDIELRRVNEIVDITLLLLNEIKTCFKK